MKRYTITYIFGIIGALSWSGTVLLREMLLSNSGILNFLLGIMPNISASWVFLWIGELLIEKLNKKFTLKVASIISTVLKGMYDSENAGSNNVFFGQVTQQALENIALLLKIMYPRMNNGEIPTLEDMLKMLYDYNIVETMCEEMKKDKELESEYKILIKYFEKNFF